MSPQLGLQTSYIYMNAFILAFGVWSIICPESIDAISMVCFKNTFVCVCVCMRDYVHVCARYLSSSVCKAITLLYCTNYRYTCTYIYL